MHTHAYACIHVRISQCTCTYVHTYACVCVDVYVRACVYTYRRQTTEPPKEKQSPMSEVGRRPEQTPSFKIKVEQTDTQKHKVEDKSMAGLGWAGLGWGSWGWGRAHGSTPGRLSGQR